jgi:hypothetical protein
MKPRVCHQRVIALVLCAHAMLHASESANYSLTPLTVDSGGGRSSSANYTIDSSAAPGSASLSVAYTLRSGYAGSLFDANGLELDASSPILHEGATMQCLAGLRLDDGSLLSIPSATVTWSISSGPLFIRPDGLVTGEAVFQDTAAIAGGAHLGFMATLGIMVLEQIPDNFGFYAADGLGDDWQVLHFGQDNPQAAPGADPDGDGQNNLFEFTAGLLPMNPISRFALRTTPVASQPSQMQIIFSPIVAGLDYKVEFTTSLATDDWHPLTTFSHSDSSGQRTVIDTSATESKKFYRVKVEKP